MNLGENIYRLRSQRNMSQGDLADALEVSRQSVSKWENSNAVPDLDKLVRMSRLFGITLDQLVGTDIPSPPPQTAPAETATRDNTPVLRILGIILLCFGLLVLLFLGIFVALPFLVIGCVLLVNREGQFFKAAWTLFAICAPLAFYLILHFIGYGLYIRFLVLGIWFALLMILSFFLRRKGKLSPDSVKFMNRSIVVALVLLAVLGIVNVMLLRDSGLQIAP